MNITQLEILRVLQETEFNISKTAEKLHIVQSAVSRQLQLFELELGHSLFERQGKKILCFNSLGQQVLAEVNDIRDSRFNIQSLARDFKENRNGCLNIASTYTQAKYLLPTAIQKFRTKYPELKIHIQQSSPDKLIEFLHQQTADVVVCTEKLDEDDKLVVIPCYEWHHIAIVPRDHSLIENPISLENLAKYPILTYIQGFTGRSAIEKAFASKGLNMNIVLAATDSEVIKTYVRLGLGVGIVASSSYEIEKDQDLIPLDLSKFIPSLTAKIAYLKDHFLPVYCQYFIDVLRKEANLKTSKIL